ncbi:hypothetical protein ACMWGI_28170 [Klebsiella pneumoniae]
MKAQRVAEQLNSKKVAA